MTTITLRNTKGSPLTNTEVDANFTNLNDDKVEKTSDTGSVIIPTGTTAQRDGTPSEGYFRYNSEIDRLEYYKDTSWQTVANLSGDTFSGTVVAPEFEGTLNGPVEFKAQNASGGTLNPGDVVYIVGISGNTPTVDKADASDPTKMPAFGIINQTSNSGAAALVITMGTALNINTSTFELGDTLFVSNTAGQLTNIKPAGEASQSQNIGYVQRVGTNGAIKVGGAGRSAATPNLNAGNFFYGNDSNYSATANFGTKFTEFLGLNSLSGLSDVVLTGLETNNVLIYNGVTWVSDQVNTVSLADDAVSADKMKTLSTLLIKNSAGTTLKTLHGAGA